MPLTAIQDIVYLAYSVQYVYPKATSAARTEMIYVLMSVDYLMLLRCVLNEYGSIQSVVHDNTQPS